MLSEMRRWARKQGNTVLIYNILLDFLSGTAPVCREQKAEEEHCDS